MEKINGNAAVKFFARKDIPLEMHKVRIVQSLKLVPVERRLEAIRSAGFNTFLLGTEDIFLDMLTDSGTNAMSDNQISKMFVADDAYAGSQSFKKLEKSVLEVFGKKYILPVHQGRAAENIISKAFIKEGSLVPMNYHFTTTLAHIQINGGKIAELFRSEAMKIKSTDPFKGNIDPEKLEKFILESGPENIPFIRMEASTNLIGGQPFSLKNMKEIRKIADKYGLMLVLDASLIGENAYFIVNREEEYKGQTIHSVLLSMCDLADIVYFSARKVTSSRGGAICTNSDELYNKMKHLVPLYEGFLTYGGISIREIEAMAQGLLETIDEDIVKQSPLFIDYMVRELDKLGIPVVMPGGALGCHVDATQFVAHVPQSQYQAAALVSAYYIAAGVRGMERGTMSSTRDENGNDIFSEMELMRLALPRRVFTLSQVEYAIDRLNWLYHNRKLIGGLRFVEEPPVLRFFTGRLEPVNEWPEKLVEAFRKDFGESL
ncbi:MAG TPA: tryptophanase [Bacteroidales bacterium]|nr:tryptophanase [Bacteroidales bacterium]OQB63675.1 MAG: Tyrosine phenol-lyase [Bacteroidetes bacterium ADurb.Bin145]HOU01290.1 tryptophanase [Bacteroidales bacterium]HQG62390.1 tryptophanase [Bacteroidales bacterium]HQK67374.1 tryptophanase [Bacteroidales bacterium]